MAGEIGITITRNDLGLISEQMAQKFRTLVKKTTFDVEAAAKIKCPVDTGALRSSIQSDFENDGMTGVIAVGMEYGPHVEFGTDRQRAQPYLTPAVEDNRTPFLEGVARILQGND